MLESIKRKGYERGDQRQDFSEDSIRLIRYTLSVIMSDAIEDGMIMLNPGSGINQGRRTRVGEICARNVRSEFVPSTPMKERSSRRPFAANGWVPFSRRCCDAVCAPGEA